MKLAVVGFGVVGSGIASVIGESAAAVEARCGFPIELGAICDLRDPGEEWRHLWKTDFSEVLKDKEIGVVAEAIGGVHPAYDFTKAALQAGRHVITSNKELVAKKGAELLAIAKENGVNYLFEASVGGGIPLLNPIARLLGAENITDIVGILNGTTNFIMTRMNEDKMTFEAALALAQKYGYAEADPTADIEGIDAARKTAILASLVTKKNVDPERVYTEGITKIAAEDVAAAAVLDCTIKLLGQVRKTPDGTLCQVTPMVVANRSQLGVTNDVFNLAMVRGEHLGDAAFFGRGAGALPTANAVVSDIVEAVTAGGHLDVFDWSGEDAALCDAEKAKFMWLVRTPRENAAEALADIGGDTEPFALGGETVFLSRPVSAEELCELKKRVPIASAVRVLEF